MSSSQREGKAIDLKNWMLNLPAAAKARRITRIVLPTAHDCVTGENFPQPLQTAASSKKAKRLSKVMKVPVVRGIVGGFSITQQLGVRAQLDIGVRYFDIRLMYLLEQNRFVCSHCVGFVDLPDVIDEFASFLRAHTGEVVVIAICEDWDHRGSLKITAPRNRLLTALRVRDSTEKPTARRASKPRATLLADDDDDEDPDASSESSIAFTTSNLDTLQQKAATTPLEVLMEWLTTLSPISSLVYESSTAQVQFSTNWIAPTLLHCQTANKRVFIATRTLTWNADAAQVVLRRVLEPNTAETDWPQAQSLPALDAYIRRRLQTVQHDDNVFTMLSFTHTPDARVIRTFVLAKFFCCCCIHGQTPLTLSGSASTLFDQMLAGPEREALRQFSALQFDFIDDALARKIVALNF